MRKTKKKTQTKEKRPQIEEMLQHEQEKIRGPAILVAQAREEKEKCYNLISQNCKDQKLAGPEGPSHQTPNL